MVVRSVAIPNGQGTLNNAAGRAPNPPILRDKHYAAASAFTPESILREARRQKGLTGSLVPAVCVLDPDGDMVRQLKAAGRARKDEGWACYHTELYRVDEAGIELGMVPCAVGASFAVLIAEQLFACGCKLLISVTSSGQLAEIRRMRGIAAHIHHILARRREHAATHTAVRTGVRVGAPGSKTYAAADASNSS
jgi:hypothetical protein